jgi:uncharacterized protein YjiS (DUF1127 family)
MPSLEVAMSIEERISHRIPAPLLDAIRASSLFLVACVARAAKGFRHRRDLETLAGLDDRMLADIGLTRSDLRFALSEPFWRDPSAVLVSRAGERASKQRRAASVPSVAPVRKRLAPPVTAAPRAA